MKKIYMSTIAAAILSTGALADSSSIKEAFENGKFSGDVTLYGESYHFNGDVANAGYAMTSIGLAYETDTLNGFKVSLAARTNHKLREHEDDDYSDGKDPEAAFSVVNVSYAMDKALFTVGRQEIGLEWIGDFHEAVVAELTYVPDTTITIGHSQRYMAVDNDAALERMADIGDHGISFIDVKYEGIENTVINPYFMDQDDDFNAYGLKATTSIGPIDLTAHYAATNEDGRDEDGEKIKDGDITHLEIGTSVSDINLALGYIRSDDGVGSIANIDDNIDPSEELGGGIYGVDADTFYGSISADIGIVSLGALYTSVKHENDRDDEIVLSAGVAVTDALSVELTAFSADFEHSNDDIDGAYVTASYSF